MNIFSKEKKNKTKQNININKYITRYIGQLQHIFIYLILYCFYEYLCMYCMSPKYLKIKRKLL